MIEKLRFTVDGKTYEWDARVTDATGPVDPPVIVEPPVVVYPPVTAKNKRVGVNCRPWNPFSIFPGIGLFRTYISSQYAWQPEGLFVQPMAQAYTNTTNGFDDYFQRAKDAGVDVLACIHQTPEWYIGTGRQDGGNDRPPTKLADRADPKGYKDYAGFLFQFAARYGRVKHPDSILRVDTHAQYPNQPKNVKRSGLGTLAYMEPWNEPSKWWLKPGPEYFTPEETAALMSACYDGHEGTLGAGVGIKTADPSMVVVMPGLTNFELPYFAAMGEWFKKNRKDGKWPCDVLSTHHYSSTGNLPEVHPPNWPESSGCGPEQDKDFLTVRKLKAFAKSLGLPLWITECGGYDTLAPSPLHIKSSDPTAPGRAMVETCKAYFAEGVERVILYDGTNEPGGGPGLFQTSGLTENEANQYKPKPALKIVADYNATM